MTGMVRALDGGARPESSSAHRSTEGSHEGPSGVLTRALDAGLDLVRYGGALRFQRRTADDGGDHIATLAMLGERQLATSLPSTTRASGHGWY